MSRPKLVIAGAGAFGLSTALASARRGFAVTVVDPGPVPHPDAASTDISKLVRGDYGADGLYTDLMELALDGWRAWNRRWAESGRPLFHETGVLMLAREPMRPGGFEHDSFALLSARGYRLERLDSTALARRYPAWSADRFPDGYYNPLGGWAESGAVVAALAAEARQAGVELREGFRFAKLIEGGGAVRGVRSDAGEVTEGDAVVIAAGTWTSKLLPELADRLVSVGQPVMVFRPRDAAPFTPPTFVPWAADIARTGWYGFSATSEGLVKVANHGPGVRLDPDEPRRVGAGEEARFRSFLGDALPALAAADLVYARLCLYSDSFDGDFLIGRHPARAGLVVAAGGSGHAFKFTPALGDLVADAVEGKGNAFSARFGWRERGTLKTEAARFSGSPG